MFIFTFYNSNTLAKLNTNRMQLILVALFINCIFIF